MTVDVLVTLRKVADLALTQLEESKGTDDRAERMHSLTHEAIRILIAAQRDETCAALTCTNTVHQKGIGRPRMYCSRSCKDRAVYAAKRAALTARQKKRSN